MISICVGLKDHSRCMDGDEPRLIFPLCVESIVKLAPEFEGIELIVADGRSTDWPLTEWFHEAAQGIDNKLLIIPGIWSHGKCVNAAVRAARNNIIMLLDADMLLVPEVLTIGMQCVRDNKMFFPSIYKQKRDGTIRNRGSGFGNTVLSKEHFYKIGGRTEDPLMILADNLFVRAAIRNKISFHRQKIPGFIHLWHIPKRRRNIQKSEVEP